MDPDPDPRPPTYLVTGASGSFGSALTARLLDQGAKVRAFSRGEHRQDALAHALGHNPRLSLIIGDVRDRDSLIQAAHGVDAIIHAAALKIAPNSAVFPREYSRTNVDGTTNVVDAAIAQHVPRTLLISSDKACAAYNSYGRGKGLAEDIIIEGNRRGVTAGCRFAAVRGGNIWNSAGSVMAKWQVSRTEGRPLVVNGPETTRFHLLMPDWLTFAQHALERMHGGEIFVPKCRAWALADLAAAFAHPTSTYPRRGSDKASEMLYSADEARRVTDIGWAYVIDPPDELRAVWAYQPWVGKPVTPFGYSSDSVERLTVEDLRELVGRL